MWFIQDIPQLGLGIIPKPCKCNSSVAVNQNRVPVKAGTQERGTERGTEVKCGPRAIITRRASLFTGMDWTYPKICFPV